MELFLEADRALFVFVNQTLANPLFDAAMPVLTDLNKRWWGLSLFAAAWLLLFWRGGRKGRVAAVLLLVTIVLTDQLNSAVLKDLFHRARPCHQVGGVAAVDHIRLLVDCGSGYSFPSSHAANNFGAAFLLTYFFRRWKGAFYLFAAVIGLSRISVGVHYPLDVLGGAIVGVVCAGAVILAWGVLVARWPRFDAEPLPSGAGDDPA
jgi:undecaprenyl-diphosphatase